MASLLTCSIVEAPALISCWQHTPARFFILNRTITHIHPITLTRELQDLLYLNYETYSPYYHIYIVLGKSYAILLLQVP